MKFTKLLKISIALLLLSGCETETNAVSSSNIPLPETEKGSELELTSEFDDQIVIYNYEGVDYAIPKDWKEEIGDNNVLYYYPEDTVRNRAFIVSYLSVEYKDEELDSLMDGYISAMTENAEDVYTSKEDVDGRPAWYLEFAQSSNNKKQNIYNQVYPINGIGLFTIAYATMRENEDAEAIKNILTNVTLPEKQQFNFGVAEEPGVEQEEPQAPEEIVDNGEPEPIDDEPHYLQISVSQLDADLENNALRAKETYRDQLLEITGKLDNIDASGKYISLIGVDQYFSLRGVQCYAKNDYQKAQIMEMKTDDIVTLRGKCTSVGEVLGYSIDIVEIYGYEPSEQQVNGVVDGYIERTASDLVNDLDNNAMKAKHTYEDQQVAITGRISNIDCRGKYINLVPTDNQYTLTNIQCFIKNSDVKEQLMNLNVGDIVTVKGKCTSVGEILGYSIAVESIE